MPIVNAVLPLFIVDMCEVVSEDTKIALYADDINLTRWSRVLRDTAASQLNDILAALRARLRDRALVRVTDDSKIWRRINS